MATAFAEALGNTPLKKKGKVKLNPTAQVALKDGAVVDIAPSARVKLDANGVVVKLDPNSAVSACRDGVEVHARCWRESVRRTSH